MNNTDKNSNQTEFSSILNTSIMDKNISTSTTFTDLSSLDDLCKNFHVSFFSSSY